MRRRIDALRAWFPRGNTLDDETFRQRHLLLCCVLGLHIPGLLAFGLWQGVSIGHATLEVTAPAVCLVFAHLLRTQRRLAAFFVAAGLVYCSSVLVHLSYGSIEAHFHFFILIGLIALYQDWVPFLWNAVFTVLSHGIGGSLDAERMYNHVAGQNRPWAWALIHGLSVLAACIGVLVFWRSTEKAQERARRLAIELSTAELAKVQVEADRRRSMSQLLVNLSRRNQSLLNRQLSLISELEQRAVEPDALAGLFRLDHMATRIRRNAESLLVLSGDEPPRRWGQPVPLPEVVRAAAAEIEDYGRVEILVDDRLEVAGRAVADLAHLLAELIENATLFSPPALPVRVRSHLSPSVVPAHVISIEDTGIGMTEADRRAANAILASTDDTGMLQTRLGFHVVNRLARRYGLHVQLAETPGDTGITALVTLSSDLVFPRTGQLASIGASLGDGTTSSPALPSTDPPAGLPPALAGPTGDVSSLVRTAAEVLSVPAAVDPGPPSNELRVPGFLQTSSPTVPPAAPPAPAPPTPASPTPVPSVAPPAAPHRRLARRVPGEALAEARSETPSPPDSLPPASSGEVKSPAEADPGGVEERTRQRARMSAMLSRFQASQRAGRAHTEARTHHRGDDVPPTRSEP